MQVREDAFVLLYQTGAVRSVTIELGDNGATIAFATNDGSGGVVFTKRGAPKRYRLDTAARLLRGLGIASVALDMRHWHPEQPQLV
ncbi:hypothetical protein [Cupriavidus pauculus]|uniref:hypothetical protein n=1 Tax=Cupriavidus pauculus TaxID=82633 RepID=UPI00385732FD